MRGKKRDEDISPKTLVTDEGFVIEGDVNFANNVFTANRVHSINNYNYRRYLTRNKKTFFLYPITESEMKN